MTPLLKIHEDNNIPKYQQIVNAIRFAVQDGRLKKGQRILSINELSDEYLLSRHTVEKAYNMLRKEGTILSVRGKGYYIKRSDGKTPLRVLLIFNKISNYKKQIYNAFIKKLGEIAVVDLKIHHFNTQLFKNMVEAHLDEYNYFVVMPHFYEHPDEALKIISSIPREKLILLDKHINHIEGDYAAVYQDFENDISEALEQGLDLLKKYHKLILVHPKDIPFPPEIIRGFRCFCMQYDFPYKVINEVDSKAAIESGEAYIVIEETDLVNLIKLARQKGLKIGKQLGIISYNETPLKEILLDGITVISTDHVTMGEQAARLILERRQEKIKNPFVFIQRKSL